MRLSPQRHRDHRGIAFTLAVLFCAMGYAFVPAAAAGDSYTVPGTESGFVTAADDVRIHYLEAGEGPAILFIPGWTMPAWIWEHQIEHFSKSYRVVAMDPRSQGESDKPTEGHYPAARAGDIKAVVDQLGLAPVVLVGWSMGVTEVVSYVDRFGTDTVAELVLVDGVVGSDYPPEVRGGLRQFAANFQRNRQKATEEFVRQMYMNPEVKNEEAYIQRVIEASLKTPTNSAIALFFGSYTTDNRAALFKIDKPTLIMAAYSPWLPYYRELHEGVAGSRLEVFENVGHALFVDAADEFNDLLEEFLADATPGQHTRE